MRLIDSKILSRHGADHLKRLRIATMTYPLFLKNEDFFRFQGQGSKPKLKLLSKKPSSFEKKTERYIVTLNFRQIVLLIFSRSMIDEPILNPVIQGFFYR